MALLDPRLLERARRLRRQDVASEARLWSRPRGQRLDGLKFVRQLPVRPYVVDFACRERKLVVEVDGATHASDEEIAYDAVRTRFLEAQGWCVIRFSNDEVVRSLEDVLETILRGCRAR